MLNQAITICITGINAAFGFFDRIMSAVPGAFSFILAMIGVFTVFRLLLVPIMGTRLSSGSSDMASITRSIYKQHQSSKAEKRRDAWVQHELYTNAEVFDR